MLKTFWNFDGVIKSWYNPLSKNGNIYHYEYIEILNSMGVELVHNITDASIICGPIEFLDEMDRSSGFDSKKKYVILNQNDRPKFNHRISRLLEIPNIFMFYPFIPQIDAEYDKLYDKFKLFPIGLPFGPHYLQPSLIEVVEPELDIFFLGKIRAKRRLRTSFLKSIIDLMTDHDIKVLIGNGLDHHHYYYWSARSKILLSPQGFSPICGRDFQCAFYQSVIIKNCDTVDSYPNFKGMFEICGNDGQGLEDIVKRSLDENAKPSETSMSVRSQITEYCSNIRHSARFLADRLYEIYSHE